MKIRQYRKKPVVVEAVQWQGYTGPGGWPSLSDVLAWGCRAEPAGHWGDGDYTLLLPTREGGMRCKVNDWIIKGVAGEFYPCGPEIFEQTYEEVSDDKEQ